jgi:hypothetical protein
VAKLMDAVDNTVFLVENIYFAHRLKYSIFSYYMTLVYNLFLSTQISMYVHKLT